MTVDSATQNRFYRSLSFNFSAREWHISRLKPVPNAVDSDAFAVRDRHEQKYVYHEIKKSRRKNLAVTFLTKGETRSK